MKQIPSVRLSLNEWCNNYLEDFGCCKRCNGHGKIHGLANGEFKKEKCLSCDGTGIDRDAKTEYEKIVAKENSLWEKLYVEYEKFRT